MKKEHVHDTIVYICLACDCEQLQVYDCDLCGHNDPVMTENYWTFLCVSVALSVAFVNLTWSRHFVRAILCVFMKVEMYGFKGTV